MTTATAIKEQKIASPAATIPPKATGRIMRALPAVRLRTIKN
jgi:hypothetical protein